MAVLDDPEGVPAHRPHVPASRGPPAPPAPPRSAPRRAAAPPELASGAGRFHLWAAGNAPAPRTRFGGRQVPPTGKGGLIPQFPNFLMPPPPEAPLQKEGQTSDEVMVGDIVPHTAEMIKREKGTTILSFSRPFLTSGPEYGMILS